MICFRKGFDVIELLILLRLFYTKTFQKQSFFSVLSYWKSFVLVTIFRAQKNVFNNEILQRKYHLIRNKILIKIFNLKLIFEIDTENIIELSLWSFKINHILTDFISPCLLVLSLFWNLRKFTFQLPPFPFFLLDLSLTMVRRANFSIFKYLCNLWIIRLQLLKLMKVWIVQDIILHMSWWYFQQSIGFKGILGN